jgi:hypothetical protein
MSGGYLFWLSAKDLLFYIGVFDASNHVFISHNAMQILLLISTTTALFMWPDTFWRVIAYLKNNKPAYYDYLMANFKIQSRRLKDKAKA